MQGIAFGNREKGLFGMGQIQGLQDVVCGFGAGADAVGNADAVVGVAGESEVGQFAGGLLDRVDSFDVAYVVLRHGVIPSINAGEERVGGEMKNLAKSLLGYAQDFVVGLIEDFGIACAAEEAADQGTVFGGAVRKFVMEEGHCQQALAFAAGKKKSEAGGKAVADLPIVGEGDGDGRSVFDGAESAG